jgi:alginate O-acetyltransferase complex protein AlgI
VIFCSYEFLFFFLPLVLAGYYLVFRGRSRAAFLTVVSYFFYGWWDWRFCGLLLFSTVMDYFCGKRIAAAPDKRRALPWLILSMTGNLFMLGFFKYYDLGAGTINAIAGGLGANHPLLPLLHLVLPVGISFYTFQTMSYAIDLYQGTAKVARSWWDFACYVALFPQLVAGPIVRYHELAEQLVQRTHSWARAATGAAFFTVGLAKKVLVADAVAALVDLAFGGAPPGFLAAWTGVLAYSMQIYFDFSGYSDMAVGLGLLFGFKFPQNFNSPYQAVSITDFWRRWHISLSSWLRDYLYIPLGGNRIGPVRTYINLFLVMLLGGLWHGANWTFVVWGGYHGILLAVERGLGVRQNTKGGPGRRALTFVLVLFGWVVFRAASMEQAVSVWSALLGLRGLGALAVPADALPLLAQLAMLGGVCVLAWWAPNSWQVMRMDEEEPAHLLRSWASAACWLVISIVLLGLSTGVLLVNSSSPFLYFQF